MEDSEQAGRLGVHELKGFIAQGDGFGVDIFVRIEREILIILCDHQYPVYHDAAAGKVLGHPHLHAYYGSGLRCDRSRVSSAGESAHKDLAPSVDVAYNHISAVYKIGQVDVGFLAVGLHHNLQAFGKGHFGLEAVELVGGVENELEGAGGAGHEVGRTHIEAVGCLGAGRLSPDARGRQCGEQRQQEKDLMERFHRRYFTAILVAEPLTDTR